MSQLRRHRILLIAAGLTYALWAFLTNWTVPGGVWDPIWQRTAVGLVFVAGALGTFVSRWVRDHSGTVLLVCIWGLTAHYSYLVYANDLSWVFVFGTYVVAVTVGPLFNTRKEALSFVMFDSLLAVAVGLWGHAPDERKLMFLAGTLTCLTFNYLSASSRLALLDALSQASRQFRELFDSTHEGIVVIKDGRIQIANESFLRMMGRSQEWVIGRRLTSLVQTSSDPRNALESSPDSLDAVATPSPGRRLRLELRARPYRLNGEKASLIAVRDVTERKQFEERLTRINRCFLEFSADPAHNIHSLLSTCGEALGAALAAYLRSDHEPGSPRLEIAHCWSAPAPLAAHLSSVLLPSIAEDPGARAGLEPAVHRVAMPSGQTGMPVPGGASWATVITHPVRHERGGRGVVAVAFVGEAVPSEHDLRFVGIIGAGLAIEEERRLAQEQLASQQVKMLASAKMSALGEMAGGVAHEINNPLAIIQGRAHLIRRLDASKADYHRRVLESCQSIESTCARIARIVRGLRAFARDEEREPLVRTSVTQVVEDTLDLCLERFKHHGVRIEFTPPEPELFVDCRPTQLSQVILNLLNNAFDALEDRGDKRIRVDAVKGGEWVEIRVGNNGPEIPSEIHDRLMQPFFTTKPVGKGTGLGLSISKGIVESHKGKLQFRSTPDWTTFSALLPPSGAVDSASPAA